MLVSCWNYIQLLGVFLLSRLPTHQREVTRRLGASTFTFRLFVTVYNPCVYVYNPSEGSASAHRARDVTCNFVTLILFLMALSVLAACLKSLQGISSNLIHEKIPFYL